MSWRANENTQQQDNAHFFLPGLILPYFKNHPAGHGRFSFRTLSETQSPLLADLIPEK
jgi:hypothetical protein